MKAGKHEVLVRILDVDSTEEGVVQCPDPAMEGWRMYRLNYGGVNQDNIVEGRVWLPPSADPTAIVQLIMGMAAYEQIWKVQSEETKT